MSIPLAILPEILSVFTGFLAFFSLFRARKALKKYAKTVEVADDISVLEEAATRLSSIRVQLEHDPDSVISAPALDFDHIIINALNSDTQALENAAHAADEVISMLEQGVSREKLSDVKKITDNMGLSLARRREVIEAMRRDLEVVTSVIASTKKADG